MGSDIMEEYKKGNKILRIFQEENAESPRDWDNLGEMVCFHKRYILGDKHDLNSSDFNGWEEMENHLIKDKKAIVILPLFLYDHSGITISISPFSCRWDSGQVGFIFVTKKDIIENFGVKKVTKKLIDKTTKILKGEVETYDQYLTGDIYGYNLIELKKCKSCGHTEEIVADNCSGFYGSNINKNGILENVGIKDLDKWELTE